MTAGELHHLITEAETSAQQLLTTAHSLLRQFIVNQRKRAGISLREAARQAGVDAGNLAAFERGQRGSFAGKQVLVYLKDHTYHQPMPRPRKVRSDKGRKRRPYRKRGEAQ